MSSEAIITVRDVSKQVQTQAGQLGILEHIDLSIAAGESIAIVGVSGSGKSTLLGLLAGLDTVTAGEIRLAGQSLAELDEDGRAALRAGQVGFVFQSFHLLPGFTARENVMLPLELAGATNVADTAERLMQRVGLAGRMDHYPAQLSGGEQQRVAIARAFVTSPRVLFADEPTGNLDAATGERVIELLFELNREHRTTLVLVTHDARLAQRCDRQIVLEAGRIVEGSLT